MLALIVNPADAPRCGRHEIAFEAWQRSGRYGEVVRERLDAPKRLRAAARRGEMGGVPMLRDTGSAESE